MKNHLKKSLKNLDATPLLLKIQVKEMDDLKGKLLSQIDNLKNLYEKRESLENAFSERDLLETAEEGDVLNTTQLVSCPYPNSNLNLGQREANSAGTEKPQKFRT